MPMKIIIVFSAILFFAKIQLKAQDLLILKDNNDTIFSKVLSYNSLEVKLINIRDNKEYVYYRNNIKRLILNNGPIVRYAELDKEILKVNRDDFNSIIISLSPVALPFGTLQVGFEKLLYPKNAITLEIGIMNFIQVPEYYTFKNEGLFGRIGIKKILSNGRSHSLLGWYVKPEIFYAHHIYTRHYHTLKRQLPEGNEFQITTYKNTFTSLLGFLNLGNQWKLRGNFVFDASMGIGIGGTVFSSFDVMGTRFKILNSNPNKDNQNLLRFNNFGVGRVAWEDTGLLVSLTANFKIGYIIGSVKSKL